MGNRRIAAGIALATAALLTLSACTGGAPATPSLAPTAANEDDTLRHVVPDGFDIGVAVAGGGHHEAEAVPEPFTTDEAYRNALATEFTSLTPENQLKWEYLRPSQDEYYFGPADAIVAFAHENGQHVRGHTLLWHSQNPAWLESGDFTPDELREILHDHIATVVGHYKGQIQYWDVANEIMDEGGYLRSNGNIWIRELGPDIVADAFRWAHEADPDAVLFLNDYNIEESGAKSDAYYALAQKLLAEGVPLGGIGIQGHLSLEYAMPSAERLQANIQRFADLGLAVAITEADVRVPTPPGGAPSAKDVDKQAEYYSRLLGACLAVTACDSFAVWGVPDTYSWVPSFFTGEGAATPLWDDYGRKPAYCAMQDQLATAAGKKADAARACAPPAP